MCLKDAEESVPEITAKDVISETMERPLHTYQNGQNQDP